MSKQELKSTKKTRGFTSDNDIDLWSSDAKLKARIHYEKSMNKSSTQKRVNEVINQEDCRIAIKTSLNRLRERTKDQKSNSSSMSNRINYLKVELGRKKQLANIAKNKYHKMMEARNKSVFEKKQLSKQREDLLKTHYRSVSLKASQIKFERKNTSMSSSLWRARNQQEAVKIKKNTVINQRIIIERKDEQVKNKRQMVEKQHKLSDISRQHMKEIKDKKIQQGKKIHDLKLIQQFAKGEMQRRKNAKLMMFFRQKAKQLQEEKHIHIKQLSQYEYMLGKCFKLRKAKSKDSFYMTS